MQKYLRHFKTALFWGIVFLLLFIPLYQKFPLFSVTDSFVSVRLEDFVILTVFIIWLIYIFISGKLRVVLKDNITQVLLLFYFIGLLSLFSGAFVTHTTNFRLALFHYLRRIEILTLLLVGIWSVDRIEKMYTFLKALFVTVIIVDIYAVGQKYLHFPSIATTNSVLSTGKIYYLGQFDRVNSTFAGHYDLAIFLAMSIILILATLVYLLDKRNKKEQESVFTINNLVLLGGLIAVSSFVLVLTAARLSFIAGVVGVLSLLLILKKKRYLIFSLLVFFGILVYPSQLRDRFISTIEVNIKQNWTGYFAVNEEQEKRSNLNIPTLPVSKDRVTTRGEESPDIAPGEPTDTGQLAVYRSFAIRTKMEWPRAIRAFIRNPLLGSGYASIGLATDNDLLRSLGEVGLLGTFAFILLLWEVIKRIKKAFRQACGFFRYYYAGVLALIIGFIVNSLLIDVFEASKVATIFWLIVGISIGASKLTKNESA